MNSEIQQLRASIEAEYQAAVLGLSGYALASRHEFISARMKCVAAYHEQLSVLVGHQEACAIVVEINDRFVDMKRSMRQGPQEKTE